MDAELLDWCEQRARHLGLTTSQFFRILAHNHRAEKREGLNIVSEQAALYGGQIHNHGHTKKGRKK